MFLRFASVFLKIMIFRGNILQWSCSIHYSMHVCIIYDWQNISSSFSTVRIQNPNICQFLSRNIELLPIAVIIWNIIKYAFLAYFRGIYVSIKHQLQHYPPLFVPVACMALQSWRTSQRKKIQYYSIENNNNICIDLHR